MAAIVDMDSDRSESPVEAIPNGPAVLFSRPFNSRAAIVVVDVDDRTLPVCSAETLGGPLLINSWPASGGQPRGGLALAAAPRAAPLADDLFGSARPGRAVKIVILTD